MQNLIKYIVLAFLLVNGLAHAQFSNQNNDSSLIQFSGVVLTADSLKPLPYCAIIIENKNIGVLSDFQGFFSLVVNKGDTISFEFLGYRDKKYCVPDTLSQDRYSIIQLMVEDLIYLNETVIYPWNTKQQFKEAFLKSYIPADDLLRARRNLELQRLKDLGLDTKDKYFKAYTQNYANQNIPQNNFLNPYAWKSFLSDWRSGAFKK